MIKFDDDEEETEEPEVNVTEAAEKVRMEICLYSILRSKKIAGTKLTKELGYISHTFNCYC